MDERIYHRMTKITGKFQMWLFVRGLGDTQHNSGFIFEQVRKALIVIFYIRPFSDVEISPTALVYHFFLFAKNLNNQ